MLNKLRYPSLLLVVITFFVLQQTQGQVTFKPGLRGGFSFSTISEMHASYKTDFYVGGFGEINLTKRYALQPEISYIRQGSDNVARNYYESNVERVEYRDLQLGYLSFAVINKFTFGPGIQIQFGPALDVLVNNNLAKRETYNDLAFITGIAYRLPSGLTFEARFKKGALDILDSDYYYNERNDHYLFGNYNTNVNFQLGLSYSFGGK
ncbi:porin family protein [Flavobacterium pectinovorum]|uniref:porin family protein n=1 Tax=Flavobacterium pectinovorum TaxID=29533 RepID=UPI0021D45C13|nr:porin family protein [Flavobacterium pectinovorum]MCI9846170.1 porin family protein [Flavobacterium pectinovorum]